MLPQERPQFGLRDYLRVIRRRKLTIGLATGLVAITAVASSTLQTKIYEGRAEVLLQARTTDSLFEQSQRIAAPVQTEIRVLKSAPVRDAVIKKIGNAPKIKASAIPETDLFEVRARNADPKRAALIANTYVRSYIEFRRNQAVDDLLAASTQISKQIDNLQKQIDTLTAQISSAAGPRQATLEQNFGPRRDSLVTQQAVFRERLDQLRVDASLRTGGAQLVTPATESTSPVEPTPKRNAALGLGVGLLTGLALAFVFEHLDDSIKVKEDLERTTSGIPVLGLIPSVTKWKKRNEPMVISRLEPTSPVAEAYRTLRTSISFLSIDHAMRTLQVTSPSASDGKSTTLANLAVALARAGQRVVVVGCDLRRPRIHEFFDVSNDVGFTNVLLGEAPLSEALKPVAGEQNLLVLASGPLPPNPSELLSSKRTVEVLVALQGQADIVLLDCPPVLPVTDAAVLSSRVDATLIVATAKKTTRREVSRAIELLRQVDAPLVGAVLNGLDEDDDHYGAYEYRYYRLDEPKTTRREKLRQQRQQAV